MGKFNLSAEAFDQAVQDGDLVESQNRFGKTVYSWEMDSHHTTRGTRTGFSQSKEKEGNRKDEKFFGNVSVDKKVGLFRAKSSASLGAEQPLAIQDAPQQFTDKEWHKAKSQLSVLIAGLDKQIQASKKLIAQFAASDRDENNEIYIALPLVTEKTLSPKLQLDSEAP